MEGKLVTAIISTKPL